MAEFIAEWTPTQDEEIPETSIPVKEASKEWLMYFDGAFSLQGAGAGVLLVAPTGEHLKYVVQMHFPKEQATNNTAEYEGLLAGLRIAADLGIKKLIVRGDSELVGEAPRLSLDALAVVAGSSSTSLSATNAALTT